MGLPLIPVTNDNWTAVRQNFNKIKTNLLGPDANPTFTGLTLSGLTASRLISTDASKALANITDLTSWIAGTTNQVIVTDDGDGTLTLSAPQNIHVDATPEYFVEQIR